jgi:hypothetical protein
VHVHLARRIDVALGAPDLADHALDAGRDANALRARSQDDDARHGARDRERERRDERRRHAQCRHIARQEHQQSQPQARHSTQREQSVRCDLDLQHEQHGAEGDQEQPDRVDRQVMEREREEQQAQHADDSGKDQPRVRELDVQPEHSDAEQQQHELGPQQRTDQALHERRLERLAHRTARRDQLPRAVEAPDPPSFELLEQLAAIARDEVDQPFVERLALGEGRRLGHGLLGELDIATAVAGERASERREIGLRLGHADVVRRRRP